MYTLDFPNPPQRPTIRRVPGREIQTMSRRSEDRGFFNHHGSFNVPGDGRNRLVVRFGPVIYLAMELSPAERSEVESHEMDHFNDFLAAARDLKNHLNRAVRQATWADLQVAWDWFNYYVRDDARNLHRSMGRDTIVMNPRPRSTAPY
ncbi:MAG: hypothetical protein HKN25_11160 [Pyrinomonadaceae bacterium]|nr:hypothetical protein [Pyrinomonadaceae bacterium]